MTALRTELAADLFAHAQETTDLRDKRYLLEQAVAMQPPIEQAMTFAAEQSFKGFILNE